MKKLDKNRPSASQLAGILDNLQVGGLIQAAQIDTLLTLAEFICKNVGITQIEGLSIRDWFQKEKTDQLERILIHFENQDPASAAFMQNIVDRIREKKQPESDP